MVWVFSPEWWRRRRLKQVRPRQDKQFSDGSLIRARRRRYGGNRHWEVEFKRVGRTNLKLLTDFGIIWYRQDGHQMTSIPEQMQTAWHYMENNSVNWYDREQIIAESLKEAQADGTAEMLEFEMYCIFLPEHPKAIYAGFAMEEDMLELLGKINLIRQKQKKELAYWRQQKVKYMLTQEHLSKM